MGAGRLLNKRFQDIEGFGKSDGSIGVVLESGRVNVYGGNLVVESQLIASAGVQIPGIIGSVNGVNTIASGIILGNPANQIVLNAWRTIYTWNVPAITPGTGSVNAVVSQDVAMSGAVIGDWVRAAPIGSFADGLVFEGSCMSNGAIHLRAQFVGTTGAYTPGNIPLKILDIQI